jgi:hypothetical protein
MPSEAEKDTGEPNEDVYEFVLPPGIPSKVIIAACKEFNTDVVSAYVDVETVTNANALQHSGQESTTWLIKAPHSCLKHLSFLIQASAELFE